MKCKTKKYANGGILSGMPQTRPAPGVSSLSIPRTAVSPGPAPVLPQPGAYADGGMLRIGGISGAKKGYPTNVEAPTQQGMYSDADRSSPNVVDRRNMSPLHVPVKPQDQIDEEDRRAERLEAPWQRTPRYADGGTLTQRPLSIIGGLREAIVDPLVQDWRTAGSEAQRLNRQVQQDHPIAYQAAQMHPAVGITTAGLNYADAMDRGDTGGAIAASLSSVPVLEKTYAVGNALARGAREIIGGGGARSIMNRMGMKATAGEQTAESLEAGYQQGQQFADGGILGHIGGFRRSTPEDGGMMVGPGTGTSDSIPMILPNGEPGWFSKDEAVLPADTVRKIGGPKAIRAIIDATHTPVHSAPNGRVNGMVGTANPDEEANSLAQSYVDNAGPNAAPLKIKTGIPPVGGIVGDLTSGRSLTDFGSSLNPTISAQAPAVPALATAMAPAVTTQPVIAPRGIAAARTPTQLPSAQNSEVGGTPQENKGYFPSDLVPPAQTTSEGTGKWFDSGMSGNRSLLGQMYDNAERNRVIEYNKNNPDDQATVPEGTKITGQAQQAAISEPAKPVTTGNQGRGITVPQVTAMPTNATSLVGGELPGSLNSMSGNIGPMVPMPYDSQQTIGGTIPQAPKPSAYFGKGALPLKDGQGIAVSSSGRAITFGGLPAKGATQGDDGKRHTYYMNPPRQSIGGMPAQVMPSGPHGRFSKDDMMQIIGQEKAQKQANAERAMDIQAGLPQDEMAVLDRNAKLRVGTAEAGVKESALDKIQKMDEVSAQLLKTTDPTEQKRLQTYLLTLSGKEVDGDWGVHTVSLPDTVDTNGQRLSGGQRLMMINKRTKEAKDITPADTTPKPKYAEGTKLKGPDGKGYIVKNGVPVLENP